jgi:hypothetical protein
LQAINDDVSILRDNLSSLRIILELVIEQANLCRNDLPKKRINPDGEDPWLVLYRLAKDCEDFKNDVLSDYEDTIKDMGDSLP